MTVPINDTTLSLGCSILDAVPECASLYVSDSDLLFPNLAWKSMLGDMSRLGDLQRLSADVQTIARQIEEAIEDETRGSERFSLALDAASMQSLLVTQVPGQPGLFLFLVRDETEIRRVEQMRKDFIANVSHELRTPLTAVRGYVETLMDPKLMTIEHVRKFMPVIFEHTERLHNLMLDLLSLSRLESPDTHIDLSSLSLADELQDAIEATAPLAALKGIQMDFRVPDDSLRVWANSEHLERVLVNLLDNAIKYSSPNGRVTIWTQIEDDLVWTHVQDVGAGIAAEELPRVFERFYRTKGAVSGRARGSGLGLAIVKHIVQQHGGEIRVSSTIGEGSDFYFCLKRAS